MGARPFLAIAVLLFVNPLHASGLLHTLQPNYPDMEGYFAWSLACAGDVDGDGVNELIVGAMQEDAGAANAGRVYVFRGQTGRLLSALRSPKPQAGGSFGVSVAGIGDVDGDGADDLLVGACGEGEVYQAGRAYVFSGASMAPLYALDSPAPEVQGSFGFDASGTGDINGDGCPDFVVGAYWEDGGDINAGRVYVFDGSTGELIRTLQSPSPEQVECFGSAVGKLGDVTGDGCSDVLVGAVYEDGGDLNSGRVYVFDGQSGAVVHTLQSPYPENTGAFGQAVSGIDDVDGDGWPDIVVGAWLEDAGARHAGRAYVFSGRTGTLRHVLQSPYPEYFGGFGVSVSGTGDVDGDGSPDVAVGTYREDGPGLNSGRAYVFGGVTGTLLYTLESPNPQTDGIFGCDVAGVGDLNNDRLDEVLIGAYWEYGGAYQAGRAYVTSLSSQPLVLGGVIDGEQLTLVWTSYPEASEYWVFGAENLPFFTPGLSPPYEYRVSLVPAGTTLWSTGTAPGVPGHDWTYLVMGVDMAGTELVRSNRVGEFDLACEIP